MDLEELPRHLKIRSMVSNHVTSLARHMIEQHIIGISVKNSGAIVDLEDYIVSFIDKLE